MAKFRLKDGYGEHYMENAEGKLVQYQSGDIVECPEKVLAPHMNKFELLEGDAGREVEIPKTNIARKRPDGQFDVFNTVTGAKLNDQPLSQPDAALAADAFGPDLEPEPLFKVVKIEALPGKPSFNVIDVATGEPVNPEPLFKGIADKLLATKLAEKANG